MAQAIRKFKEGGNNTPEVNTTPPKGKFIKDGIEYVADDDFMKQFNAYGSSLDPSISGYFADIRDVLMRGETVIYDSQKNELSPNVKFKNLNERQDKRMMRNRSKVGMFFDALSNNKVQNTASAISSLKDFSYVAPTKVSSSASFPISKLNFTNRSINYITDKNGKKIYANRPSNEAILSDINNLINYFKLGETGDSQYQISGINTEAVRDWYNRNPEELEAIKGRIMSGSLTDQDWGILNDLKISNGESVEQSEYNQQLRDQQAANSLRESLGITKDNSQLSNALFSITNNRRRLENWRDYTNGLDKAIFTKSSPFAGTALENYFLYNGNLYSPEEVRQNVDNIGDIFRPFRQAMENYDFDTANTLGVEYWGNNIWENFNPNEAYNPYFSDHFRRIVDRLKPGQNFKVAEVTQMFDLPQGARAIYYLDPSEERDTAGFGLTNNILIWDPNRTSSNGGHLFKYNDMSQVPYKKRQGIEIGKSSPFERYNWELDKNNKDKYAVFQNIIGTDNNTNYPISIDSNGELYLTINGKRHKIVDRQLYLDIAQKRQPASRENLSAMIGGSNQGILDIVNKAINSNPNLVHTSYGYVPRHQWGGILDQLEKTRATNETTKVGIKGLSNIGEGAAVKNIFKEGELTGADKWQLGAIAGDLGALITSIPTGGNAVAAGLGAGSTISQFVSDVKRDGLDWGDVGRGLGSLGLDAITLLPGVGIAGKTAKTIKLLKRSSKLLGGAFAAAGLVNAASSLSNLTESGRDWTIDDLRNVLNGVQSIIGVKRLTTDKLLATKKLPKETKSSSVENIETRKKALVDEKLKNDSSLTDKYVNEKGEVDYTKATKELISKTELAKLNAGKIGDIAKNKASKFAERFKPAKRELRSMEYDAVGRFPRFMQTMRNRAIGRYQANNPEKFGNKFVTGVKESQWTGKEVPVYGNMRSNNEVKNGFSLYTAPYLGRESFYVPEGISKASQKRMIENNLVTTRVPNGRNEQGIVYNYFVNSPRGTEFETTNLRELNQYLKSHRKGGKINKFQPGGFFSFVKNPNKTGTHLSNVKLPEIDPDSLLSLAGLVGARRYNNKVAQTQEKGIRAGLNATLTPPQEIYNSFTNYGIPVIYEQKAIKEENYKPVTSDAVLANALQQQGQAQANQTRLEGRLKNSELFSNYLNQNADLKRRYAEIRADVENKNRQIVAGVNSALAANEAARLTNDFTSFNNWLTEKRAKLAENTQQRNSINSLLLSSKLEQNWNSKFRGMMAPYQKQFEEWMNDPINEDKKNLYSSADTWLAATNPTEYNRIQNLLYNEALKAKLPYYNSLLKGKELNPDDYLISYKKGGKTSTYSRYRPANEEVWINQNKAANEAVKMLNQNILRLFLKATSYENKKV